MLSMHECCRRVRLEMRYASRPAFLSSYRPTRELARWQQRSRVAAGDLGCVAACLALHSGRRLVVVGGMLLPSMRCLLTPSVPLAHRHTLFAWTSSARVLDHGESFDSLSGGRHRRHPRERATL